MSSCALSILVTYTLLSKINSTDSPTPSPLNVDNTNYLTSWYQPHQPVYPGGAYSRSVIGFDANTSRIWLIGMCVMN